MRLVFVTQTLDAEHPVARADARLVRALAGGARSSSFSVRPRAATRAARERARAHVRRRHAARARRPLQARAAARAPARPRPDAVLAHMVPLFLVLAAPLAKPLGVRLALWYTHWHAAGRCGWRRARRRRPQRRPALLPARLAEGARDRPRDRRRALRAVRDARARARPLRLLALGRTARWKGYETMLARSSWPWRRGSTPSSSCAGRS